MSAPSSLLIYTDAVTVASGATRAAPTLQSDGMDLNNVKSYRVLVSADSGHTLLGVGWMRAYLWSPLLGRYVRNFQLDFPITAPGNTWANVRTIVTAEFDVGIPVGAAVWAPDGVTTDSGVVTTYIEASKANGSI